MEKIYLLYGLNRAKIMEKRKELLDSFDISSLNISFYDAEEDNIKDIIADCNTIPLLGDIRAIVVKSCSFLKEKGNISKDEEEALTAYLNSPSDFTVLILESPYELKKSPLLDKILLSSKVFECALPKSDDIREYVLKSLGEEGISIDEMAIKEFIFRMEEKPDEIETELSKLKAYAYKDKIINKEAINQLVFKEPTDKMYLLSSSILEGNSKACFEVYKDLLANDFHPLQILKGIVNSFMFLTEVKDYMRIDSSISGLMQTFKVSQGRAYHLQKEAKEHTYDEIKKIFNELKDLDYKSKVGATNLEIGLELFFLK